MDKYARKSLMLDPTRKRGCQWLFQKAVGATACDWNVRNHHKIITFYKELVEKHPAVARNYLELMDNLLADNRTKEAEAYLKKYAVLEDHMEFQIPIYEGRIALAEHNVELAEQKFRELEERFPDDFATFFELANYYADKCDYDKAIAYYEKSFEMDKAKGVKPLFTDALWGEAIIYEIQEKYEEAIKCYDRILQVLDEEFGFTEGEPIREATEERQRLIELAKKQ